MTAPQKRLLLFDLDWTVLYSGGAGLRALNYAFLQHYKIEDAMKTISPDGKTDPAIVREMIKTHLQRDPHEGEIDLVCASYVARLPPEVSTAATYQVLPGIPKLLEALAQKPEVYMGLGTGNLEGGAQAKLARSGLMRYFKFGGYANDSEHRPDVLRAAVRRGEALAGESIPQERIVVIGDNFRDVTAGKAIGARTIAVATGSMSVEELRAYNPDFLFSDLSDTPQVLAALLDKI